MHLRLSFLLLASLGCAQAPVVPPSQTVAARPGDVASIEGLMTAFYEVVNVEPGGPVQWDRDRTLYVPWIHFVSVHQEKDGPKASARTHPEFVAATAPLVKVGFHERELKRRVYRYGNVAHVESSYESREGNDPTVSRGVNFLELYFDGTRWWVASAVWQTEDPTHPVPPELLP